MITIDDLEKCGPVRVAGGKYISLDIYVNWMAMTNAIGGISPMVLIVHRY
jgi:hypothetical protein